MQELLSKEHYCYKIDTSLMENSALSLPQTTPPIWITLPFLQENLDDFSEISTPI